MFKVRSHRCQHFLTEQSNHTTQEGVDDSQFLNNLTQNTDGQAQFDYDYYHWQNLFNNFSQLHVMYFM